jgi:chorismate mutase/prephenate dehydratase
MINERASIVVEIGKIKTNDGREIYAPDREQKVFETIDRANKGPLSTECLRAIYRELMSGSFALEKPLHIGFLGPDGSFSHAAARKQFGASVHYVATPDIHSIFRDVARKELDIGLAPIENSLGGGIVDTLDSFLEEEDVVIRSEILFAVHQQLLGKCDFKNIRNVYSKPEVFSQCRQYLSVHLPHSEQVPVSSTSRAAELASQQEDAAAIASSMAAEIYKLKILASNIEDSGSNITRFLVIGREPVSRTGEDKTAIMFTTAHRAGALAEVLDVFRDNGINLTHIDKRPSNRTNWEYYFFIDAEGHREDEHMIDAIEQAREHCLHLKVLGSFPKAREVL